MMSPKPPKKKPSTTRRKNERQWSLDSAMEASVQESVRAISELIEDAKERGAFDRKLDALRTAIDEGDASGVAEDSSLAQILGDVRARRVLPKPQP